MDGNGILISKAQEAINDPNLTDQLRPIRNSYSDISEIISKLESPQLGIKSAIELIDIGFKDDPCEIKRYIRSRIQANDILEIIHMKKKNISPDEYSLILNY